MPHLRSGKRVPTITWELDLSILSEAGIALTKTPPATERADLAGKILRRV
jgi:hypothetical protein